MKAVVWVMATASLLSLPLLAGTIRMQHWMLEDRSHREWTPKQRLKYWRGKGLRDFPEEVAASVYLCATLNPF